MCEYNPASSMTAPRLDLTICSAWFTHNHFIFFLVNHTHTHTCASGPYVVCSDISWRDSHRLVEPQKRAERKSVKTLERWRCTWRRGVMQRCPQYLLRIIKARLTELSVIVPALVADLVLLLHLAEGGKPVWTLGHTHLRKSTVVINYSAGWSQRNRRPQEQHELWEM